MSYRGTLGMIALVLVVILLITVFGVFLPNQESIFGWMSAQWSDFKPALKTFWNTPVTVGFVIKVLCAMAAGRFLIWITVSLLAWLWYSIRAWSRERQ